MPYLANRPHRYWTSKPVDYNKIPGQGRFVVNKFYKSPAWRSARLQHLSEHPFCVDCEKEGSLVFGNIVDHIKPINPRNAYDNQDGRYGDPLDPQNMQTMCEKHHNKKSARERNGKTTQHN